MSPASWDTDPVSFRLPTTQVNSTHMNRIFCALLKMMKDHIGLENAPWLCRVNCEGGGVGSGRALQSSRSKSSSS